MFLNKFKPSFLLCHFRYCGTSAAGAKLNYYEILGIKPDSDAKTIKEAFYEQSKKLHPDKRPEDENAPLEFNNLVEAYEVLGDTSKRKSYDKILGIHKVRNEPTSWRSSYKPRKGVKQADLHRSINVDLSEERMKKAWEAYKDRWKREEEYMKELEEKKIVFRCQLDQKRDIYEHLSEDEREHLKESMRLFRHPDSVFKSEDTNYGPTEEEQENKFYDAKETYYKNSKNNSNTSFEDLYGAAGDTRKTDDSKTGHKKDATNDFNAEDYIKQDYKKFNERKHYSESDRLSEAQERLRQERYAADARMKDPFDGSGSEYTPDYEPLFNPGDFRRQGENRKLMEEWTKNLRKLRQEMEDEYKDSKKDVEKSLRGAFKSGGQYDTERGVTNPQVPYNVPDKSVVALCVFFLIIFSGNYYLEYHYAPKTNPYLLKLQEERKKLEEKSQQ